MGHLKNISSSKLPNLFFIFTFLICGVSLAQSNGGMGKGPGSLPPITPPPGGGGGAGGGGGGKGILPSGSTTTSREAYTVNWSFSLERSIEESSQNKTPILVYFEPSSLEKKKKKYKLFETKSFSEASSEYSFVRFSSSKKKPLRELWSISDNKHTFHICDWYGNSLKSYSSKGLVKAKTLIKNLEQVDQLMKKIIAKHEKSLKKALSSFNKEDYLKTLKHLDNILAYKGYDVVNKANDLVSKVTDAVKTQVDEINSSSDTASKKSQLEKLLKIYEDYPHITKLITKKEKSELFKY